MATKKTAAEQEAPKMSEAELEAKLTKDDDTSMPDEIAQAMAEAGDQALQDAAGEGKPKRRRASTTKKKADEPAKEDAPKEEASADLDLRPGAEENEAPEKGKKEPAKSLRQVQDERRASRRQQAEHNAQREAMMAERSAFLTGIASLQNAMRRHTVLTGTVVAVETLSLDEYGELPLESLVRFSVILDGRYKVMIPYNEFFRDQIIDMSTMNLTSKAGKQDYIRTMQRLAEKVYDAEVDFIISGMDVQDMNDYSITGSRVAAMAVMEQRNFVGVRGGEPNYQKGDYIKATVLATGINNIRVTAGGVDAKVGKTQLTFRYILNLEQAYHTGDELTLRIHDVIIDKNGRVQLQLDGRSLELEMAQEKLNANLAPIGTKTTGTITTIRKIENDQRILIYAWLDGFNMPAVIRAIDPRMLPLQPRPGDKVRLEIYAHGDNGFVRASCTGFHRASTLIGR